MHRSIVFFIKLGKLLTNVSWNFFLFLAYFYSFLFLDVTYMYVCMLGSLILSFLFCVLAEDFQTGISIDFVFKFLNFFGGYIQYLLCIFSEF